MLNLARLLISGGNRLSGAIKVQGAKNSVLPILAATVLCKGENVIHNCPELADVRSTVSILRYLGCEVKREGETLLVNSASLMRDDIPDTLMREMRSSIVFLGAVLSRTGKARLSFPGGCELGPRPIDLHLKALRQMGAQITERHGVLDCTAPDGLYGAKISLSFPSVGATENIILAAVCANGTTVITNAAREPEICDLSDFLNACGAKIYGSGDGIIVIDGVDALNTCSHAIIPDRIVAMTYIAAAAATGGKITLKGIIPSHFNGVVPIFEESGCDISFSGSDLQVNAPYRLHSVKLMRTMPYPGFPTDAQAPVMAMLSMANGTSVFVENIFESRYKHVGELIRLGANIKVEGRVAIVEGVQHLSGATVEAMDLRGAAALVVAGLAAEGTTELLGLKYLERGYQDIEIFLTQLGADIKRI